MDSRIEIRNQLPDGVTYRGRLWIIEKADLTYDEECDCWCTLGYNQNEEVQRFYWEKGPVPTDDNFFIYGK